MFAALLYARGAVSWANFGLWQLRTALEEDGEFVELRVHVAAEWIDWAGHRLYGLCKETVELDEALARALAPGKLFKGKAGFTKERWTFWKSQFNQVARTHGNMSVIARGAVTRMDSVDLHL